MRPGVLAGRRASQLPPGGCLRATPGADPITPMFLALPLLGLFEASVLILAKVLKR